MIGIDPYTGETVHGLRQLILRIERLIRTVLASRVRLRGYGTTIHNWLGKNNSVLVLTSIQNTLLTEMSAPINGLTDLKLEQVKVMPDGKIFIVGEYNGQRTELNIRTVNT